MSYPREDLWAVKAELAEAIESALLEVTGLVAPETNLGSVAIHALTEFWEKNAERWAAAVRDARPAHPQEADYPELFDRLRQTLITWEAEELRWLAEELRKA